MWCVVKDCWLNQTPGTENERWCVRVFWHQFDTSVLCGLVFCLVADPAERRGRHRTPYKLPLT